MRSHLPKAGGQLADNFRPFPVASLRFVMDRLPFGDRPQILYLSHSREIFGWWLGRESNPRHEDFQSSALPTELPSLPEETKTLRRLPSVDKRDGGKSTASDQSHEPSEVVGKLLRIMPSRSYAPGSSELSDQRTRPSVARISRVSLAFLFKTE
jgi:hypothetical protein